MTVNEYSMAYTHESAEDIALLTSDFLPCLEGLHIEENFQYARNTLQEENKELFDHFFAAELVTSDALPENWREQLTTLVAPLKDGSKTLADIDPVCGVRHKRAAYQVCYTQALVCLMSNVYDNNPDKPERKPYEPVLTLIEKPTYYTPFKAAA